MIQFIALVLLVPQWDMQEEGKHTAVGRPAADTVVAAKHDDILRQQYLCSMWIHIHWHTRRRRCWWVSRRATRSYQYSRRQVSKAWYRWQSKSCIINVQYEALCIQWWQEYLYITSAMHSTYRIRTACSCWPGQPYLDHTIYSSSRLHLIILVLEA